MVYRDGDAKRDHAGHDDSREHSSALPACPGPCQDRRGKAHDRAEGGDQGTQTRSPAGLCAPQPSGTVGHPEQPPQHDRATGL